MKGGFSGRKMVGTLEECSFTSAGSTDERVLMAKVTNYIPEPKEEYDVENQEDLESLTTLQNQLNFSFQQDLKNEQDTFNYFLS